MTIKHHIEEELADSEHLIVYPVSAESKLKTGFFQLLQRKKGKAYSQLAIAWAGLDREKLVQENVIVISQEKLPIIIVPCKVKPLGWPTFPVSIIGQRVVGHLKRNGIATVALARSHWLNMRYTLDQYIELIDALESEAIVVHEYE